MNAARFWGMALLALLGLSGFATASSKSWGPQVVASNPHHKKPGQLEGVVGPHGQSVRCGGKPLLVDPWVAAPLPPRLRRVEIRLSSGGGELVTGPSFVLRCAGPGQVAWYVAEEDPLRKGARPGAPITLNLPAPGVDRRGSVIEDLVTTGGCVPVDGVSPPCLPPRGIPILRGHRFSTFRPLLLELEAKVRARSSFAREGATSGSASVTVTIEVDGNRLRPRTFVMSDEQSRVLTVRNRFRLPPGKHQVGLIIEGSGYDYVNVRGLSATLSANLTKTFRLR